MSHAMLDKRRLKRYQELATLLIKCGRRDFLEAASAEPGADLGPAEAPTEHLPSPEELAADLVALGPTFVKLAQMLSTRGDMLPQPFLDALSRLQEDVEPC